MANYILQEIQTNNGTTALVTPVIYPNREQAESAFYTTCGSAVISQVETHTVMVYTEEGFPIPELTKCFKHTPAPVPEIEPTPEPEGQAEGEGE